MLSNDGFDVAPGTVDEDVFDSLPTRLPQDLDGKISSEPRFQRPRSRSWSNVDTGVYGLQLPPSASLRSPSPNSDVFPFNYLQRHQYALFCDSCGKRILPPLTKSSGNIIGSASGHSSLASLVSFTSSHPHRYVTVCFSPEPESSTSFDLWSKEDQVRVEHLIKTNSRKDVNSEIQPSLFRPFDEDFASSSQIFPCFKEVDINLDAPFTKSEDSKGDVSQQVDINRKYSPVLDGKYLMQRFTDDNVFESPSVVVCDEYLPKPPSPLKSDEDSHSIDLVNSSVGYHKDTSRNISEEERIRPIEEHDVYAERPFYMEDVTPTSKGVHANVLSDKKTENDNLMHSINDFCSIEESFENVLSKDLFSERGVSDPKRLKMAYTSNTESSVLLESDNKDNVESSDNSHSSVCFSVVHDRRNSTFSSVSLLSFFEDDELFGDANNFVVVDEGYSGDVDQKNELLFPDRSKVNL